MHIQREYCQVEYLFVNTQIDNTQVEYLVKYSTWVDQADKSYKPKDLAN